MKVANGLKKSFGSWNSIWHWIQGSCIMYLVWIHNVSGMEKALKMRKKIHLNNPRLMREFHFYCFVSWGWQMVSISFFFIYLHLGVSLYIFVRSVFLFLFLGFDVYYSLFNILKAFADLFLWRRSDVLSSIVFGWNIFLIFWNIFPVFGLLCSKPMFTFFCNFHKEISLTQMDLIYPRVWQK